MSMFLANEPNQTGFLLTLLIGFALALGLVLLCARREAVKPRAVVLAAILSTALGWFCAHILYCIVMLDKLISDLGLSAFVDFSREMYMLYGGVGGVLLGLFMAAKISGEAFGRLVDSFAPGGFVFIAALRVAEGFSGQGFSEFIWEENAFCRFPFAVYDPMNELWVWALFVLEALFALIIAAVLLMSPRRKPAGDKGLLGMGLYACGQIVFESLRRDNFLRWGFVRCSEVISGVVILVVLICYLVRSAGKKHGFVKTLLMALFLLMAALCLLLEFATEGKIDFLLFLETPGQCYLCMAAACAVMAFCVLLIRRLSYKATAPDQEQTISVP